MKAWLGAAAVAALFVAVATPAAASFISTDSGDRNVITGCALGPGGCTAPTDFGFSTLPAFPIGVDDEKHELDTFNPLSQMYVYRDGIVSFGAPLPDGATPGNAASLGGAFAAPGFADYSGDDVEIVAGVTPAADGSIGSAGIWWKVTHGGVISVFDLFLSSSCADAYFDYGSTSDSWVGLDTDPWLPDGALVGFNGSLRTFPIDGSGVPVDISEFSSYSGFVDFAGLPPPSGAPEPGVWAMLVMGFGGLGALLRRRRPARAFA